MKKTEYTMSIPDYWRTRFGAGRAQGYEAAKRGDLPTIDIGGRKFVPTLIADEKFGFTSLACPKCGHKS